MKRCNIAVNSSGPNLVVFCIFDTNKDTSVEDNNAVLEERATFAELKWIQSILSNYLSVKKLEY